MPKYNMKIEKMQVPPRDIFYKHIKMVRYRNVVDVTKMNFKPRCSIKKISQDSYMTGIYNDQGEFYSNGEVFQVLKKENQMRNRRSLRKIFTDLRQLIGNNFWSGSGFQLFVTLTYREQTDDHKQIHLDFKNFWARLKRKWVGSLDYISIVEPHASGCFHVHLLLTSNFLPPPWGDNATDQIARELHEVWKHGYVTVELLNSVESISSYFIAYFTNMELTDDELGLYDDDIVERNGKKYIKGKRLDYYPDYMQIYRHSAGIKKPEKGEFDLQGYKRTYESTTKISDENFEMYVTLEQYKKNTEE